MDRIVVYTADTEMPSCLQCDNFDCEFNCENFCGPEHGWYGYRRTEKVEEKDNG